MAVLARRPCSSLGRSTRFNDVASPEHDPEQEPQRRDRVVENRCLRAILGQMQLKPSSILKACRVGPSARERSEILDGADLALLGLRGKRPEPTQSRGDAYGWRRAAACRKCCSCCLKRAAEGAPPALAPL